MQAGFATLGRALLGGLLMGLANLVPGISGGTMLVASGIYPRFIVAIAELTSLRFRREDLLLLLSVGGAAAAAILLAAGSVRHLVLEQRWVMYSLFIGLTLGGVPVLWRMLGGRLHGLWPWIALGFTLMALLALLQAANGGATERDGWGFLLLAGVLGSAAMILPGISGGYLLIVLGVYVPILSGLAALGVALRAVDLPALLALGLQLLLPVGLGVLLGMAAVSHLLRWLLRQHERPTLALLLGLLLGAVVGLWPFQQVLPPQAGQFIRGEQVVQAEDGRWRLQPSGRLLQAQYWPTRAVLPEPGQALAALALVLGGFLLTGLVDRVGRGGGGSAAAAERS